jgi:hypothetical protein
MSAELRNGEYEDSMCCAVSNTCCLQFQRGKLGWLHMLFGA